MESLGSIELCGRYIWGCPRKRLQVHVQVKPKVAVEVKVKVKVEGGAPESVCKGEANIYLTHAQQFDRVIIDRSLIKSQLNLSPADLS